MKSVIKTLVLFATIVVGFGCDNSSTSGGVLGCESVEGYVRNENGEGLGGIRVDVYYDKELTQHYPQEIWESWEGMSEDQKKERPWLDPVVYTLEDGSYGIAEVAFPIKNPLDLYVVATDTSGIYETKVQSGQLQYKWGAGWLHMDFVLKKK